MSAAILHASWNALVKGQADKHLGMAAVVIGHAIIALPMLPFLPPLPMAALPYLVAGMVFHFGYQLNLLLSYRLGDLIQVYPIARGSAPMIVALVSVMVLGISLSYTEIGLILLIGVGILSLTLTRHNNGMQNPRAGAQAFLTGCFIAGYSLSDGHGARIAGDAFTFWCWLAMANAAIFTLFMMITKPGLLRQIPKQAKLNFYIGGPASFAAYALVTWAFTQAPIALVTALRETSIVFALMIGVLFLGERFTWIKLFSTLCTMAGASLLVWLWQLK